MSISLPARPVHARPALNPTERILRRRLIFQDSLSIVTLIVVSICIGVLTYFFFRSFQQHRSVLEKRWYTRGQKALQSGRPADAVPAFRSALALSAANPNYEMSLAEALAASGHTEEAYAYFSSLHDAEPGDGFLNLQLARLEVRRNDPARAIAFYQAALNGVWYGQGAARRLQIRLELAKYLLTLGKSNEAQGQLLAAEGNSLDQPGAILNIANLLSQASDPSDAWTAYRRVETHPGASPRQSLHALEGEASVAESLGQYKRAAQSLDRYSAKARQNPTAATTEEKQSVQHQKSHLQQLLQLIPFYALPPKQHADRVLRAAAIAHRRYLSCSAQLQLQNGNPAAADQNAASAAVASPTGPSPDASSKGKLKPGLLAKGLSRLGLARRHPDLQTAMKPARPADDRANLAQLGTQWDTELHRLQPANLAGNAPLEETLTTWTIQTEILTAKLCGTPTGDDALLLQLAQTPDKTE